MMEQGVEDRQGEHEDEIEPLMALLRDSSKDHPARGEFPLRRQAVFGARIGDPRAVVPLVVALQESEVYVQRYVAEALAKVGDARAVVPLCIALGHPDIAQEALHALRAVLERTAGDVPIDDLRRVASLEDDGRAVVEVPDTDGGYLSWNQVEERLDCRPVKQLARQELARRGLAV
jgi:HEAT repeat protein